MSNIKFTERDVEDYIEKNPQLVTLRSGEKVIKWTHRQFKLPSGILDLMGIGSNGSIIIAELKNVPASADAITQVSRYHADIVSILKLSDNYSARTKVEKVIVVPGINKKTFHECIATDINVVEFSVSISITASPVVWTRKYEEMLDKQVYELSRDQAIIDLIEESDNTRAVENEILDRMHQFGSEIPEELENPFQSDGQEWYESPDDKELTDDEVDELNSQIDVEKQVLDLLNNIDGGQDE